MLGFLGLFIDFDFLDLDLETVAILKFRNVAALLLMHMYMNLYMYTSVYYLNHCTDLLASYVPHCYSCGAIWSARMGERKRYREVEMLQCLELYCVEAQKGVTDLKGRAENDMKMHFTLKS